MQVKLITIGNSKGIRIPKPILQQVGWEDSAELEVRGDSIILRPSRPPRAGWEDAFRKHPPAPLSEEEQAWLEVEENDLWKQDETW